MEIQRDENFCGSELNVGIGSRYALQVDTNFTMDDDLATALHIVLYESKTVAVVGTNSGQILKVGYYFFIIIYAGYYIDLID